jgi:hypothetical protein
LKEEDRLLILEKRASRRIFEPVEEEVTEAH